MALSLLRFRARTTRACWSCHRSFQTCTSRGSFYSASRAQNLNLSQEHPESSRDEGQTSKAQLGATNELIPYPVVRLVDPQTNKLHPPAHLATLLAVLDKSAYVLTLTGINPDPIVKLVKSEELYKKSKEEKKKKKAMLKALEEKEIQMTWGVDQHDFKTKLKQARRELETGCRVNLVFAPKKGQPWLNAEGMTVKVQEAVDRLADVGKEWKARDIQHATTIVYLQGEKQE